MFYSTYTDKTYNYPGGVEIITVLLLLNSLKYFTDLLIYCLKPPDFPS